MYRSRIVPHRDLAGALRRVDMPARYTGGEFGQVHKTGHDIYRVGLTYPDLYEIGMSNTAIKILYGMVNAIEGVAAERVFVPAPDFEAELREHSIPLYTLEDGRPLRSLDLLAVSFGFELLATNVLNLLDLGDIPTTAVERDDTCPLVIAGGPGATNPMPLAPYVDGIFVGEAEAALPALLQEMRRLKQRGAGRSDLTAVLDRHPNIWTTGSGAPATRAIWTGFAANRRSDPYGVGFPLPALPVVQDHGPVEIMRGCPHACRFCHAAVYYRPFRSKSHEQVVREVAWLVHERGYREISLSSLSTGDYAGLPRLLSLLQARFQRYGVSFQLPSLRVDSVTLPLIESLNGGKRSGLTFAVEAGDRELQCALNKPVPLERVIAIARDAAGRGWRHAKLYFMLGMPGTEPEVEVDGILEYVTELRRATRMDFIVNTGTFVPKPHTPYQWDAQLSPDAARAAFDRLASGLPKGASLRSHDPWLSQLEGVLARGDKAASQAIDRAYRMGARLDAWGEHLRRDIWDAVLAAVPGVYAGLEKRDPERRLPWEGIDLGTRPARLRIERRRADLAQLSDRCAGDCSDRCGVCSREARVDDRAAQQADRPPTTATEEGAGDQNRTPQRPSERWLLILGYRRRGPARYMSHLGILRILDRYLVRSGLPLSLSEGYAPKPRISFGQPLPLGCASDDEILCAELHENIHLDKDSPVNWSGLPEGMEVLEACVCRQAVGARKIAAPMQRYGGIIVEARGDDDPEALSGLTIACAGHNVTVTRLDDGHRLRLELLPEQPGLGRLLKEAEVQRRLALHARELRDREGGRLFNWYAQQASSVWRREPGS